MLSEEEIAQVQGQIQALQQVISTQEPILNEAGTQLAAAEAELNQKQQEAEAQSAAAKAQLEQAKAAIESARAQLAASEQELIAGQNQADEGQQQIDAGWSGIYAGEAEIEKGEKEIAENEQKLADARKEYENGQKEADEKIKDGEDEIKDAEDKIEDIEDAEWYVEDRSVLPEYTGYGDNADRLRAIGAVFPILFFVVAALISLTTMTRMVEEQRTQIGTLKALGYGKFRACHSRQHPDGHYRTKKRRAFKGSRCVQNCDGKRTFSGRNPPDLSGNRGGDREFCPWGSLLLLLRHVSFQQYAGGKKRQSGTVRPALPSAIHSIGKGKSRKRYRAVLSA